MATLEAAFNSVIVEHAPERHSIEVAWALWACLGFELPISEKAAACILQMEDSVSSLLLFRAHNLGLFKSGAIFEPWRTSLGEEDLKGARWLLTYQLARMGFTLDATGHNYVTRDPLFGFLYGEGVTFFDSSKVGFVPVGLLPEDEEEEEEEEDNDDTDDYSEGTFWDEWDDWPIDHEDDDDSTPSVAAIDGIEELLAKNLPGFPAGAPSVTLPSPPPGGPSPTPPTHPSNGQ